MVQELLHVMSTHIEVNKLLNLLKKSLSITNLNQTEFYIRVFINAEILYHRKLKILGHSIYRIISTLGDFYNGMMVYTHNHRIFVVYSSKARKYLCKVWSSM